MFCGMVVVFLLVNLSNTLLFQDSYTIPEPLVEVLKPRGFRISIEDSSGISSVAFYVNINKDLRIHKPSDSCGNIYTVRKRWTYEEPNALLKIGDTINFAIFVTKDKLNYRRDGLVYLHTDELESTAFDSPIPYLNKPSPNQGQMQPGTFKILPNGNEPPPTTLSPESYTSSHRHTCEDFFLNCSETLITMQYQMEALKKTNRQLSNFIENSPDAKKLTLSGRIPPDDNPAITVRFIISEKLDLNPRITSAVRKSDNSIEFEVETLSDKLEILDVAKDKLKHSKIDIS